MVPSIWTTRGACSGGLSTASACSRAAGSASTGTVKSASISSVRSVNSQPLVFWLGRPSSFARAAPSRRRSVSQMGSAAAEAAADSANRALHLQLDQAVHLDRVLHREFLSDRLDEAVDDHLGGLLLVQSVGLEVEDLLLADLRDRCLVADVDVVLADPDRRVGVGARVLVEQQRIADNLGLRLDRALGDLEQAAVAGPTGVLRDRLGEDRGGRLRRRVDDLAAGVLVLSLAREGDREDLAVGALTEQVD